MFEIMFTIIFNYINKIINISIKSLTATTQECYLQYWTSPGGSTQQSSTQQSSSNTATYHPSRKVSKFGEQHMQDTVGEVGTNS